MRYSEPILTTDRHGDGLRVTACYENPETARMMTSLRAVTAGVIFVGGTLAALWILSRFGLSNQVWLLAVATSVILTFAAGQALAAALHRRRFFARGLTDITLVIDIDRRNVSHAGTQYPRGGVLRFTAQPHRAGRHEERDERVNERLISTTYREAYQVWLQQGEGFTLLANVSDEKGAGAIVRRLQEVDERMDRADEEGGGGAFGERAAPT